MKRFILIIVLTLFLTGCDIVTEIPDDSPILKDDIKDIFDDDDDDPNSDQSEEDIIIENIDHVFAQMDAENGYSISHEVEVTVRYPGSDFSLTNSRIETSIEMDREEQYYLERIHGQFKYADPDNPFGSFNESRLIDGRSGTLREYSIVDNYVTILQEVENQTFLEFIATEATPYELDFEIEDFITIDRREDDEQYYIETGQRDNNYDITMALSDFGNDELASILSELGIPDIENEIIDLFLNVNEWYILYRFEYVTTFTMDDVELELVIQTNSRFHYTDHIQETISVFEEPYVITLPSNKDDIVFTSSNEVMPWHGLIANQEGWTRQVVEPGIYSMYIDTYSMNVDYTLYDEDGQIITFERRLIVTEPTTFYVKLISTEDTMASAVFRKLDIEDVVIDHTHALSGGTITGYHEGQDDSNIYYLQGTSEVGGYLNIDVSSVNPHVRREELSLITATVCPEDEPNCERIADYCGMTDEDRCIAYIDPNTSYTFEIVGSDIGGYTFTYTFVEHIDYPSDLESMYNIDDFEPDHLFHIKKNQDIYLRFDVLIFDQYSFFANDFNPYMQSVNYEIYDENGVLQETNWQDKYDLARGTYYIKLTTIQHNIVFTLQMNQD